MTAFDTYPRFSGPQGKTIALIAGTTLFAFTSMMLLRKEIQEQRGNKAIHAPAVGPDYMTKDAISVVARPAKNANVKGSMPSASQWV